LAGIIFPVLGAEVVDEFLELSVREFVERFTTDTGIRESILWQLNRIKMFSVPKLGHSA
jgi:hypothetical protein